MLLRFHQAWAKLVHKSCQTLDGDCHAARRRRVREWILGLCFAGSIPLTIPFVMTAATTACSSKPPPEPETPALYELELTACTAKSDTLTASILCENEVRARYKRPSRALPKPLPDGGVR